MPIDLEDRKLPDRKLVEMVMEYNARQPCAHNAALVSIYGMKVCLRCLEELTSVKT